MTQTIYDIIQGQRDDAIAIGAPSMDAGGRPPMTFARLKKLIDDVQGDLSQMGVGRNDRVAIVLPNGPEMASSFVAIACSATTAPLNPAYGRAEFDFYLEDLKAKALVLLEGEDSPAAESAKALGVPVIRLDPTSSATGAFRLFAEGAGTGETPANIGYAAPADTALVLHTSGTTSRPKIVPLSHANVTASARHIGQALRLIPGDRCLNIMPLFHIHGLIAAVLSSLAAGASVWCAPGFNALKAFAWLDDVDPTWYTAVPTMHQAILGRAPRNKEVIEKLNLRLIRSSSSSLPPQVMAALEETFGCPVIESYGMTEAAHQMASNPLPPAARKPGAVGVAAGPEVAIMDEATGALLPQGEIGEVVIRGPNVTKGYESNPEANASAFVDGWFRTGDQGALDEEGYLRLTGRLKEIINRGGEKVSPLEVDEAIMDHPAVAQCVTFAMPHKSLGEDVAAAVVLRDGETAAESDIRAFVLERLADFKAPRKIVILDEIPKGATGKLQRIGLAEKLGLG